ncbi:MAG TPA: radical SAM family heme chaperone HemW [Candidatus Kapabacteria bacterium]|nr:radical SAM family heme chaperone HemW [Candidatus Kapabacteria bacterium]
MINKEYGLYIHFPYCIHKCSYCDFYSIENLNSRNQFAKMLSKEIDLRLTNYNKPVLKSIFFGGGTPSLMKPHQFEQMVEAINRNFNLSEHYEWTIECNPGTIDSKNLEFYKQLGANRLSFGVQSFNMDELQFLERIHNIDDIYKSVSKARSIGFDNINIDLMFALPNQTIESWANTLERAIELETEHISCYSLIYEEGTPLNNQFLAGKVKKTDEDADYLMYNLADKLLTANGFEHYEVSNYSKNNKECKHNMNYWEQGEYFSFGPSAHGYLDNRRYWNYRNNHKYFALLEKNELPEENFEILKVNELILERIYLELRSSGLDFNRFQKDYHIDLYNIFKQSNFQVFADKIEIFNNKLLKLNSNGYFTSDSITLFISELIGDLK